MKVLCLLHVCFLVQTGYNLRRV